MTAILAAADELFREHVRDRLLEAGCVDVRVVEFPAALASILRECQDPLVVIGGRWPEPRLVVREAVAAGTPVLVLLQSSTAQAERETLAAGARAALRSDIPAASLAAAIAAVHSGLIVLDRPFNTLRRAPSLDTLPHERTHRAAGDRIHPVARQLTAREREILSLVASGTSNKGIARALGVSANTVKFHLAAVFEKLSAATRAEAVAEAIRRGELSL